ncbi:MAG: NAD(P)-binding protein [Lachnospiraceae bacterium]|nr:NAD(P)-binding protein [Lachnospiraceae bacterium]
MIRISQLKSRVFLTREELIKKTADYLGISPGSLHHFEILKESIDARKKGDLWILYSVAVSCDTEGKLLKKRLKNIEPYKPVIYKIPRGLSLPADGTKPVIIGAGPAGLFCAYYLALCGLKPVLLERGKDVDARSADVEAFWKSGRLDPASNVQFGEGGAGTFSDGKLNTGVKDPFGRNRFVLETFVECGAPGNILYDAKPHIGTDLLRVVVRNLREKIIALGGEVRFEAKVTGLLQDGDHITGVELEDGARLLSDHVILAIGHSARDTFRMLDTMDLAMEAKAFAVGFRIQHPQKLIDDGMYGKEPSISLPPSPYKLTAQAKDGRGVYSFCMCPGGYVVNASSEEGMTAVNGMSYSDRQGKNANSAIVVSVSPDDFQGEGALAGLAFQEAMEKRAFAAAKGKIPYCRLADFPGTEGLPLTDGDAYFNDFTPECKGEVLEADLSGILDPVLNKAFVEGMEKFAHTIYGFCNGKAILCAAESRTSSPVRIPRDPKSLQSIRLKGLYPCGEGAGYAGGIVSAAMDGLKVGEAVLSDLGVLE